MDGWTKGWMDEWIDEWLYGNKQKEGGVKERTMRID
jgi:hypothetical protein